MTKVWMVHAGKTKWQISHIFFTNTAFNAAVLCNTYVLQFRLLPQMKQERKEI